MVGLGFTFRQLVGGLALVDPGVCVLRLEGGRLGRRMTPGPVPAHLAWVRATKGERSTDGAEA